MLEIIKDLTPCATQLWMWLRGQGRPFTTIEIDLTDFCKECDYSRRWAKIAYQQLIDHGLWEETKRWPGGRDYRGMIIDPSKPRPTEQAISAAKTKKSKK